mmetsp:Transcript_55103/g.129351  ORF Transcript_55103/g.129351 Transcript_55103/m.129351 type:complete len:345 (-) Transcript_55103:17-1051(-)
MALMFQRAAFVTLVHLALTGMAASSTKLTPQNLLVWNPHWQCFVWNQNDCAGHVKNALNTFLVAFDVDFAGIIELSDVTYTPTPGWEFVVSRCGHDVVHLFYNSKRWYPSNDTLTPGCMLQYPTQDRPYILQHFSSPEGAEVIVAAAHFPHPMLSRDESVYSRTASTELLQRALGDMMDKTGTDKVVLMADTNAYRWISNDLIWATQLELPGPVIGSQLMNTCCLDADFPPDLTFDRIIANFGNFIYSAAMYNPVDLPNWTRQVLGDRVGAFHRPVLAQIETVQSESHGPDHRLAALWTAVILLGISTVVLASILCIMLPSPCWRLRPKQDWSSEESSSSESIR